MTALIDLGLAFGSLFVYVFGWCFFFEGARWYAYNHSMRADFNRWRAEWIFLSMFWPLGLPISFIVLGIKALAEGKPSRWFAPARMAKYIWGHGARKQQKHYNTIRELQISEQKRKEQDAYIKRLEAKHLDEPVSQWIEEALVD